MTDLIGRNIIAGLVDTHDNVHWEDIIGIPSGVVRCKDCKHWYPDADCGMACELTNMSQPEDGYCNWGVKKDGMD